MSHPSSPAADGPGRIRSTTAKTFYGGRIPTLIENRSNRHFSDKRYSKTIEKGILGEVSQIFDT